MGLTPFAPYAYELEIDIFETSPILMDSIAISHPLMREPSFTMNCSLFPLAKGVLLPLTVAAYSTAKMSPASILLPWPGLITSFTTPLSLVNSKFLCFVDSRGDSRCTTEDDDLVRIGLKARSGEIVAKMTIEQKRVFIAENATKRCSWNAVLTMRTVVRCWRL